MKCQYCGKEAKLVKGTYIYPNIVQVENKYFYRCDPCDAHVGCHPRTRIALGPLANPETRKARREAHNWFDPLWQSKSMSRKEAYKWMSNALGVPLPMCHIGMFDAETCNKLVSILRSKDESQAVHLS